jgi:FixJ family two-component response regulator
VAVDGLVYVVDDDADIRDSLRWLLESVGLDVRCFADGRAFLAAHDPMRPGCLITDVRMQMQSGLTLLDELSGHGVRLPVIVITGHADVPTAVRAMKSGAVDFMEKPFNEQDMLDRIMQSLAADADRIRTEAARTKVDQRRASLTGREAEVLALVMEGLSSRSIGGTLGIAVKTVDVHRARIMRKMGASNLAELLKILSNY